MAARVKQHFNAVPAQTWLVVRRLTTAGPMGMACQRFRDRMGSLQSGAIFHGNIIVFEGLLALWGVYLTAAPVPGRGRCQRRPYHSHKSGRRSRARPPARLGEPQGRILDAKNPRSRTRAGVVKETTCWLRLKI